MNKIYLFVFLSIVSRNCNSSKDGINKKLIDSVYEIHIKNSTPDSFGGLEEYKIRDKAEIVSFCNELLLLHEVSDLESRPYYGAILIEFYKKNSDGSYDSSNLLSTGIIFKPDKKYFIDYSRGRFRSDSFLTRILKYLQIDESKFSALDSYMN